MVGKLEKWEKTSVKKEKTIKCWKKLMTQAKIDWRLSEDRYMSRRLVKQRVKHMEPNERQ